MGWINIFKPLSTAPSSAINKSQQLQKIGNAGIRTWGRWVEYFCRTEILILASKVMGFSPKINQASSKIPMEQCTLTPKQECRDVSVLVPSLVPVEKCINVPRELCSKVLVPRKIKRMSTRLYCDGDKPGTGAGSTTFFVFWPNLGLFLFIGSGTSLTCTTDTILVNNILHLSLELSPKKI